MLNRNVSERTPVSKPDHTWNSNTVHVYSQAGVREGALSSRPKASSSCSAKKQTGNPDSSTDLAASTGLEGPLTPPLASQQQCPAAPDLDSPDDTAKAGRRKGLKAWLQRKPTVRSASNDSVGPSAPTLSGDQPGQHAHVPARSRPLANSIASSAHDLEVPVSRTPPRGKGLLGNTFRRVLSRPAYRTGSLPEVSPAAEEGTQAPLGSLHVPTHAPGDFSTAGPLADSTSDFGAGAPETPNSQGGVQGTAPESSPFSSHETSASHAQASGSKGALAANLPGPSFGTSSSKAWQEKYLASVGQGAPGGPDGQQPAVTGLAGRWRKNLDESATGAVVEELLDMPKLQRMARQRTNVLEIEETEQELKLLWHIRLNGGREILKVERFSKDGSIVEAPRKDGRDGQQRSFLSCSKGHFQIRGVQGDPHGALFHERFSLSSRGNRMKIDHKLQLLLHGVAPVKYTTIWNRLRDDEPLGPLRDADDLLSTEGVDAIIRR